MAAGNQYHEDCLKCTECAIALGASGKFVVHKDKLFCNKDYDAIFAPFCARCLGPFHDGLARKVEDKRFHSDCLVCSLSGVPLSSGSFVTMEGWPVSNACSDRDDIESMLILRELSEKLEKKICLRKLKSDIYDT